MSADVVATGWLPLLRGDDKMGLNVPLEDELPVFVTIQRDKAS
jgi:hypothetical protein